MNEGLMWFVGHRSDVLLAIMVAVLLLNIYTFFQQRRVLVDLRRMLLWARYNVIERRPMVLNGVGHRYPSPRIVGGEHDDE